jgi:hypothetical protein
MAPARGNRGLAPRSRGVGPPAARTDRCASLLRRSAVLGDTCTDAAGIAPPPNWFREAVADRSGECALLEHPRANNSAALRVADPPCAYASRKPLHALTALRGPREPTGRCAAIALA